MSLLTESHGWKSLVRHRQEIRPLRELFRRDKKRFDRLSTRACGLLLDYSKQRVTERTLELLIRLAEQQQVKELREAMDSGQAINTTEGRAVLHSALRGSGGRLPEVDAQVQALRRRVRQWAEAIESGEWRGYSGKPITDVVSLGIGGSYAGPEMVVKALHPYHTRRVRVRFVSNVAAMDQVLETVNPETTLFLIISKSFQTPETLLNAAKARDWLLTYTQELGSQVIAICHRAELARDFGVKEENILPFWDWVGGRFSVWSAVGLPVALAIGVEAFERFLDGADAMDQHFISAPLRSNLPFLMGMIGVWNINFCRIQTLAILPYDHALRPLIRHLQQLEMESNGKSVDKQGRRIDYHTAPIVFGDSGSEGQHTFYQLFHQGTHKIACDFLLSAETRRPETLFLIASCLAQTRELLYGTSEETVPAEQALSGNHPTTTLVYERLDPQTLGALLALYEHKVFVQGAIWNINSFDQWGVEHGKRNTQRLLSRLKNPTISVKEENEDLIEWILKAR